MESVVINLWGVPVWVFLFLLGYLAAGWQIQHVWHFHPIVLWCVGHLWQAVVVVCVIDAVFNPSLVSLLVYFMGTLLFLSYLRKINPISEESILGNRRMGDFTIQDKESYWLAAFHWVGLSWLL